MEFAIRAVGDKSVVSAGERNDPFLRDVTKARTIFSSLERLEGRTLTAKEVGELERFGNWATDWSTVRVSANTVLERVRGCSFNGPVLLGDFTGEIVYPGVEGCSQPCGVYNSTLAFCVVGDGALVKGCSMMARCLVGPGAAVVNCGLVSCSADGSSFSNGMAIAVGPETCGRELACYATMSLAEASAAAVDRTSPEAVKAQKAAVDDFAELARCGATVISRGAVVMSCPRVVDAFVGESASLDSCSVEQITMLSTAEEPSRVTSGSFVQSSLIQHGVTVDRGCIVTDSMLMEHSHVDNHGKVSHSVLGPDSGVGAGECLHCLVGPFVGFHHQSLLIATIWPLGRGNVGYGANVGSNHTSRQADQEIWPGEGVFFGLSTVIKFPANYSESPFSVIGSGVTCLPQRVAFPFCLINSQEQAGLPGVSPGLNHLRPGWVLSESMYMVIRNQEKYRRRAKARRNRVDWPVFRPSMIRLIADARARLVAAGAQMQDIYVGDRAVSGLGKNYMTEASRLEGIATYTLHLRRYALRGLLARLDETDQSAQHGFSLDDSSTLSLGEDGGGVTRMPPPVGNALETAHLLTARGGTADNGSDDDAWELQRGLLMAEYGDGDRGVEGLLEKLVVIEAQVAKAVETSKARDDKRGSQVIPGYADAHTPANLEAPVKLAYSQQAEVEGKAHALISRL